MCWHAQGVGALATSEVSHLTSNVTSTLDTLVKVLQSETMITLVKSVFRMAGDAVKLAESEEVGAMTGQLTDTASAAIGAARAPETKRLVKTVVEFAARIMGSGAEGGSGSTSTSYMVDEVRLSISKLPQSIN